MEIGSTFLLPHLTHWWQQQEETHSKYADPSNVGCDIFSILPHGVVEEANFSLGWDVIGWRQSKTTGETLRHDVVVRLFSWADNGILAHDDPSLDTTNTENNSEMKTEKEERKLHRMAKIHDLLEMRQGSQNLRATQMESRARNKQMTPLGYILDMEEIIKAPWLHFQHDGAAALILSERSPLPPPLSANDLPGGWTQISNVRRIGRINRHPVESDEDSAPESILDTEDWLHWNGDLDNQNDSQDNCPADSESDIEQDNSIEDPEWTAQQDVSTTPNVRGLNWPARESQRQAEKVWMMVNAIEMGRHKGVKKK